MRTKTAVIIIGILLFTCFVSHGQRLRFKTFTSADGLPANEVYTLHQDKLGYLWACTSYGIVKYNGALFTPVCTNIPFKEQFAYCMFEDKKGTIWFANSQANIYEVRNDSAFIVKGIENMSAQLRKNVSEISSLYVDDSLNIYASSKWRSYKLVRGKAYKAVDLNAEYSDLNADLVAVVKDNFFIPVKINNVGTDANITLKIISDQRIDSYHFKHSLNGFFQVKKYNSLCFVIVGDSLMNIKTNRQFTFKHPILSVSFNANKLWIGVYQDGLYELDTSGAIINHYFQGFSINYILFDNQNGLWLSTEGNGLLHCKNIDNLLFDNYPGLSSAISFVKKLDTELFIGTAAGELYTLRNKNFVQLQLKSKINSPLTGIYLSKGNYYIAAKNALLKSDKTFKNLNQVFNNKKQKIVAYSLAADNNDNLYAISRTELFSIKNNIAQLICNLPAKAYAVTDYKDKFLIATQNGLYIFSPFLNTIKSFSALFDGIETTSFCKASGGDIWVGTRGNNLFHISTNEAVTEYPVPGKSIHDIYNIDDTTIGICLNTGIFENTFSSLSELPKWCKIDDDEVLAATIFNNRLYAGTSFGLQCFSIPGIPKQVNSKFYFKKAFVDNTFFYSNLFQLNHNQDYPTFCFDFLNFEGYKPRLMYSLNGLAANYTNSNSITFEKLPPGTYTLQVQPELKKAQITSNATTVYFTIVPAYWEKMWFKIVVTISIIGFFYLCMVILYKWTKNKEQKKLQFIRTLAETKLTALKAQINSHFISNSLSAIQELILDNETEKAGQYLARFNLFLRHVLKNSGTPLISLNEEIKGIETYIELEKLRFKQNFQLEKNIDVNIDQQCLLIPSLILQPLVENAIWHGLLPLKGKKQRLILEAQLRRNEIIISVEDNGIGRKLEAQSHHKGDTNVHGTELIKSRLNAINMHMGTTTASLEIVDMFDAEGKSSGTRVLISIPNNLTNQRDAIN